MIKKVVSGGQTGADVGGLWAAKNFGLETGGKAPKGYKTEEGNDPSLLKYFFNLEEDSSYDYRPRTEYNVLNSCGTIIFNNNPLSSGSTLTASFCRTHNKPLYILSLDEDTDEYEEVRKVVKWLVANDISTLNVAGNRESVSPGLGAKVEEFLNEVFLNGEC